MPTIFYSYDVTKMRISLGQHDRSTDNGFTAVKRGVSGGRPHEGYEPKTYNNDIAILELDQPVDFSSEVRPACLPQDGKYISIIYKILSCKY